MANGDRRDGVPRTAVILAAGMGSRLREVFSDAPKGFIVGHTVRKGPGQVEFGRGAAIPMGAGHAADPHEQHSGDLVHGGLIEVLNERGNPNIETMPTDGRSKVVLEVCVELDQVGDQGVGIVRWLDSAGPEPLDKFHRLHR